MALRVSQIQCAGSEQGLLRNYLCRRWPFSPEQNIKWNSISTSPRQKKERKLQSNSVQMYSEMESALLISSPPPPLLIRFRDPPPRDSIHSQHVFPYIRFKWENGSEGGSTSGHSEKLKISGFRCLFIFFYLEGIRTREKFILGILRFAITVFFSHVRSTSNMR
ncbi:hypothetical protein CDAR_281571 [Caerostris darwini]|uniref:Uncharacterized protein n=1 Tax=Caerostris darwini TaxID=1538125 RepID=A0AAV4QYW8_9ARAC|nr:hypothetical protein CDAR_281571 [Caerostris darwini]